jgi:hypothetical protein
VHSIQIVERIEAERNPPLICHNDDLASGAIQGRNGFGYSGKYLEVFHPGDVLP